jgi:hypothetical protein
VANQTTLTSRTLKSKREKDKKRSTGNTLYRLALEEEERRSRRQKVRDGLLGDWDLTSLCRPSRLLSPGNMLLSVHTPTPLVLLLTDPTHTCTHSLNPHLSLQNNALLEDEAAEEEEEGAQAGLGDFGFGVTSNIREHDEEQVGLHHYCWLQIGCWETGVVPPTVFVAICDMFKWSRM